MKRNKLILISIVLLSIVLIGWLIIRLAERASIVNVPQIKGKVVDAETGEPLKGTNVRAGWVTGFADPGGGSFKTFKVYATKTDETGEFVLPPVKKFKIPIIESYTGINVFIYEHGYSALYRDTVGNVYSLGETDDENTKINKHSGPIYVTGQDYEKNLFPSGLKLKMKVTVTEQDYIKNLGHLSSNLSSRTVGNDIPFMIKEYQIILQKFPSIKDAYIYHQSLGYLYETYEKNYEAALNEYKQSILINKDSSFAGELQEKIKKMQTRLREKGREDSK